MTDEFTPMENDENEVVEKYLNKVFEESDRLNQERPEELFRDHCYVENIPFTALRLACKDEDRKHFGILCGTQAITTYDLDKFYMPANDGLIVEREGKCGLVGLNSLIFVEPVYDDVCSPGPEEWFIFVKDGVEGYVTSDKQWISVEEFNQLPPEEHDELFYKGIVCD